VRNFLSFLALILIITSCKQIDNQVVANAFHHNLYLSEVMEKIPYFASKEDSLLFMEQYVETWILRQTLLAQAKNELTQKEQDFSSQIAQYKEQLLINAYLQKISRDSALFVVSRQELADFLKETKINEAPEYRDMVKLNYIKLSDPSKLYKQIKELFFEEKDRLQAIKQLELLSADTIEYYLDSEHWLYADFIEKELPFSFSHADTKEKFEIVQNGYRYLVLILDRRQQLQPKNTLEEQKFAQSLLQQRKRVEFFTDYKDSLVQKALFEKKAIRYPILF
jgi:CRP-like cAMP-binding protein